MVFLGEAAHGALRFVNGNGQEHNLATLTLVGLNQEGHFVQARGAPGGPKIDDHRSPREISERDWVAIQIFKSEVRRWALREVLDDRP